MRYLALCCDYDGTLASDGRLLPGTVAALERFIESGRRLVLVTGRELDELKTVCPRLDLFSRVVAENGALLFDPASGRETPLGPPPPQTFLTALRRADVPVSVGRVIVATWEPHQGTVLDAIRRLGLELQVIFNKGAVMILPAGMNKATGLAHALAEMGLSPRNAVAIGDAENDHALLGLCECSAAVANALPSLKQAADIVTSADHGAGVAELIAEILADDLASRDALLLRHLLPLGVGADGRPISVLPRGERILALGEPAEAACALHSLVTALATRGYSICLIGPPGPLREAAAATRVGTGRRPPSPEEVVQLLEAVDESACVELAGLAPSERGAFLASLLPGLASLRARLGRPHWIITDASPGFLGDGAGAYALGAPYPAAAVLTDAPQSLDARALRAASLVVAAGPRAGALLAELATVHGHALDGRVAALAPGEALAWRPRDPQLAPARLRVVDGGADRGQSPAAKAPRAHGARQL